VKGPKSPVGVSLTEWYSRIGIAGLMLRPVHSTNVLAA
jgi:hypothetical protein